MYKEKNKEHITNGFRLRGLNDREEGLSSLCLDTKIHKLVMPIALICSILITSSIALADDTTTETCANGAGTVITGAVTGHKYCLSNNKMNWWNAISWCDGQNRRLFDLSDCECSDTVADCVNYCPEMKSVGGDMWIWTVTPRGSLSAYIVSVLSGFISYSAPGRIATNLYALCY